MAHKLRGVKLHPPTDGHLVDQKSALSKGVPRHHGTRAKSAKPEMIAYLKRPETEGVSIASAQHIRLLLQSCNRTRLDLLEASGQLERLMRSGLRHCERLAVNDAHAAGEIEPVAIRRIGPDLVFARLWKESGIPEVLRSVTKGSPLWGNIPLAEYFPFRQMTP
jgi:hypothetical protein